MNRLRMRLLPPARGNQLVQELVSCGLEPARTLQIGLETQNLIISITATASLDFASLDSLAVSLGCQVVRIGVQPEVSGQSSWLLIGSIQQLATLVGALSSSGEPDASQFAGELSATLENDPNRAKRGLAIGSLQCDWGSRTYIMGIVNVTPDSFSGDGLLASAQLGGDPVERAVEHGLSLASEGADILDIGGESSRPGSQPVDSGTEMERILPVIRGIRRYSSVPISVDTMKASVFAAALDAGADILNDISAMQADPAMPALAARSSSPVVLMHRAAARQNSVKRGSLGGYYHNTNQPTVAELGELLGNVISGLADSIHIACQAGVSPERIIVDPGIGFGKAREENLYLVNHLDALKVLGAPILLGVSRKAFIGYTLDVPVDDRLEGTLAAVTIGIVRGADLIRVHDVKQAARAARMTDALVRQIAFQEGAA